MKTNTKNKNIEKQTLKVIMNKEGSTFELKMDSPNICFVIGQLLNRMEKKTGISQEAIVKAILAANKEVNHID